MNRLTMILSRITDIIIFAQLFWFLSALFPSRFGKKGHIFASIAAIFVGSLLIILWEKLPNEYQYNIYFCNFILVGALYSAVTLRGSFLKQLTACVFYVAVQAQLTVVQMTALNMMGNFFYGRIGLMQIVAAIMIIMVYRSRMRKQIDGPKMISLVILVSSGCSLFLAVHSNNKANSDQLYVLINGITLLVMNIAICLLSLKLYQSVLQWKMLQSIQIHQAAETITMKEIDTYYHEMQTFRHEIRNHLQVISGLAQQKDLDALESYLKKVTNETNAISAPVNSGNTLINAVLQQKLSKAQRLNIPVQASVWAPAKLDIEETELCALLCNLLDNAIEASQKVENPHIDIVIKPYKRYLRIDINNRVEEDILSVNPNFNTSKSEPGHGIGLNIVRQIAQKYGSMLEFYMKDGFFHAKTMLKIIPAEQNAG